MKTTNLQYEMPKNMQLENYTCEILYNYISTIKYFQVNMHRLFTINKLWNELKKNYYETVL